MKRNYNFDEEELNQEFLNFTNNNFCSDDLEADDSFYDEKVNQWFMEDFDEDEGF